MSGHTPGPWRIDRRHDDYEIEIVGRPTWPCQRFGVKGEWDVCKVEPDSRDADANAAVIMAAPEMLDALHCALVIVRDAPKTLGREIAEQKINAAIARATASLTQGDGHGG